MILNRNDHRGEATRAVNLRVPVSVYDSIEAARRRAVVESGGEEIKMTPFIVNLLKQGLIHVDKPQVTRKGA